MAMASASPNITSYFNRGPLTTTFTPPTTCLQTLSVNSFYVGGTPTTATFYGNWFGFDAGYSCLPTGTMPGTLLASPTYWGTYWYSPGLYCPTGWTTAGELGPSWNGLHVTGSTSGAICCPSSMSFYATDHQCREVISEKATITIGMSGVVVTSTLETPITVYADGIPLIWEKSDLPKTTSASTTSLSTQTSTAAGATGSSSSNNNRSGGLSEGAKIGIGIGIPMAAIAIGVAIFFYFLNRHKTAKEEPHAEIYDSPRGRGVLSELAAKENSQPFELGSRGDRSELPSNTQTHVHELA
ncbi:hypothetical protein N7491_001326 [Penicillium cf. griseofulvum]|uniref:Mid2 domain-containing protein n=1 Tax=Penicillium cf. griseofulvum TaxID=2972120 RepID=A0A9W9JBI4_9EURO|nr:hypothetical protein N7472_006459 [Penicillium cf. griseofulvum]KAJ5445244.1 hypothetical protein N7491_001326 [Penicillium cf. griseofulvum]KAJ5446966.1 hypothetical protein N7445_001787 [Penicillium cf. griseofulvum]